MHGMVCVCEGVCMWCVLMCIYGGMCAYVSVGGVWCEVCVCMHVCCGQCVCEGVWCVCMWGVCVCTHLLTGPHTLNSVSYTSGFPSGVNGHLPAG